MKKHFTAARAIARLVLAISVMMQPVFALAVCSCFVDCEQCSARVGSESCCCAPTETRDSPTCCSPSRLTESAEPEADCCCCCSDAPDEPLPSKSESDPQSELVDFGAFASHPQTAGDELSSDQADSWLSSKYVPSHNTRLATLSVWRK